MIRTIHYERKEEQRMHCAPIYSNVVDNSGKSLKTPVRLSADVTRKLQLRKQRK
jgi:hypothetical protein